MQFSLFPFPSLTTTDAASPGGVTSSALPQPVATAPGAFADVLATVDGAQLSPTLLASVPNAVLAGVPRATAVESVVGEVPIHDEHGSVTGTAVSDAESGVSHSVSCFGATQTTVADLACVPSAPAAPAVIAGAPTVRRFRDATAEPAVQNGARDDAQTFTEAGTTPGRERAREDTTATAKRDRDVAPNPPPVIGGTPDALSPACPAVTYAEPIRTPVRSERASGESRSDGAVLGSETGGVRSGRDVTPPGVAVGRSREFPGVRARGARALDNPAVGRPAPDRTTVGAQQLAATSPAATDTAATVATMPPAAVPVAREDMSTTEPARARGARVVAMPAGNATSTPTAVPIERPAAAGGASSSASRGHRVEAAAVPTTTGATPFDDGTAVTATETGLPVASGTSAPPVRGTAQDVMSRGSDDAIRQLDPIARQAAPEASRTVNAAVQVGLPSDVRVEAALATDRTPRTDAPLLPTQAAVVDAHARPVAESVSASLPQPGFGLQAAATAAREPHVRPDVGAEPVVPASAAVETHLGVDVAKIAAEFAPIGNTTQSAAATNIKRSLDTLDQTHAEREQAVGISVAKTRPTMSIASTLEDMPAATPPFSVSADDAITSTDTRAELPAEVVRTAHRAVEGVMEVAERFAMRNQHSVNLQFNVHGNDLNVRVEMRAGEVHTTFTTDSAELQTALAQEWSSVATQPTAERSFTLAAPTFASSDTASFGTPGRGASQEREPHADTGRGPSLASRDTSNPQPATSEARPMPAPGSVHLHTFA